MREAFDMMAFVDAAYALTCATTLALLAWCWLSMRRAERLRDESRGR